MSKQILTNDELENLIILNQLNNEKIDWCNLYDKYQLSEESRKKYCTDIFNFVVEHDYSDLQNIFLSIIDYIDFNNTINKSKLETYIMMTEYLTEETFNIILSYVNNIDKASLIDYMIVWNPVSEKFIEKYMDEIDWESVCANQNLSEEFIEKYKDKIDWDSLSIFGELTEDFIEKYNDKLDWNDICHYQRLSESFMEKYQDKINWQIISRDQSLSEQFIEKFQDRVDWNSIINCQTLSKEFLNKFED